MLGALAFYRKRSIIIDRFARPLDDPVLQARGAGGAAGIRSAVALPARGRRRAHVGGLSEG